MVELIIHNIHTALPGKKMPGRVSPRTGQRIKHSEEFTRGPRRPQ
jgi:hypothetical protein